MKLKIITALFLASLVGMCVGWFANTYWDKKVRKNLSIQAVISANAAAQKGDFKLAIKYSAYALALDNESPLADIQLTEYIKKSTSP